MQAVDQNFSPDGPPQLATYTADNSGNLHTTSTPANMPQTAVGTVTDLKMAPSGKLLAVGGTAGLQVFHFNGSSPITHGTGLLTKSPSVSSSGTTATISTPSVSPRENSSYSQ